MARLIKSKNDIQEGEIFNKWLRNRVIRNNKNVLSAITGPTGSSKSYQDLRRAELWHREQFNEEFPTENICFSVGEVMRRVSTNNLRKGEIIIFEEAGANLGSLDFQNRVCKLFTYVLQTFRTLNIIVFFNLPYLSMLNKSARLLIHVHFETCGIDFRKKVGKSKGFFRQVNQSSGKVYNKYLRIKHNGKVKTIKRFNYKLPSKRLIKIYEAKKIKFVTEMNLDFTRELEKIEQDKLRKMDRSSLSEQAQETMRLMEKYNGDKKKVAEIRRVSIQSLYLVLKTIKRKGYQVNYGEIAKKTE